MSDVLDALQDALLATLGRLDLPWEGPVPVQEVPPGKPGDYGSPVAFMLAKAARRNPAELAAALVAELVLPTGVAAAKAVGPYINFDLDAGAFVPAVIASELTPAADARKVIVEHTSVNPNKEAHVGHLRNIVLGDACARILKAVGHDVEVQNYIDDTGRQAAESLFAVSYFKARYPGAQPAGFGEGVGSSAGPTPRKYDHWLGHYYVQLTNAKQTDGEAIERGVTEVMHRLERGELRSEVERIVRSQLETFNAFGAEYDLLVWESDVVQAGFLAAGLDVLEASPHTSRPTEGKYAGALVLDVSEFLPGLEEPLVVLVRSDGNAMYVAKDIGYQYWKAGMYEGLGFERFALQPSGKPLYSSSPEGELHPDGRVFGAAQEIINVIDVRQSHPQTIVKTSLALSNTPEGERAYENSHHLAYEVVTLEGQPMSGRRGITLSIDEVMVEATRRARAVVQEKNPDLATIDEVANAVGLGALRFSMLKSEARKIIDFRWDQALSLQGDSAPYVQYAHARACSILRAAAAVPDLVEPVHAQLGPLEVRLAQTIARFQKVVEQAAAELAPHSVAQYALDLATAWNSYYNHKDESGRPDTQVLRSAPGLREARLALVDKVRSTLAASLALLGIDAPAEM
ncbi:MAG: arginine--tRNA ligase [Trueperaceae bacterium]|nr:arginine--tRNA ligase [Trueperaceae bacterium]